MKEGCHSPRMTRGLIEGCFLWEGVSIIWEGIRRRDALDELGEDREDGLGLRGDLDIDPAGKEGRRFSQRSQKAKLIRARRAGRADSQCHRLVPRPHEQVKELGEELEG